jgi:hypothetical protein
MIFPKFAEVIAAIDELRERGAIAEYAIFGAMAQLFWDEAIPTWDLDVLVVLRNVANNLDPLRQILEWAAERNYPIRNEHVVISDFPVQFVPVPDALHSEALENAAVLEVDGVSVRVVRPEYLIAIWLVPGSGSAPRRRERAAKLKEDVQLDANLLADLKVRYNF